MAFEPKRFWEQAHVVKSEGGYTIHLDERPLKTPLKRPLIVPSKALATEIAAEWQVVEGIIDHATMPYTQFAHAGLDQAIDERKEIAAKTALYGETDLLCYRAETPQELAERQAEAWDPILQWSAEALDAPLLVTKGIVHLAQPEGSLNALAAHVQPFQSYQLKALYDWVTISGSLILGLAVAKKRLTAAEGWALSRVDESWQEEQWGVDDEAQKLSDSKRDTFLLVERALSLI
ncbi:MAG: ATPase [Rhodobacteraceae bacterium]|nr:ATPase [Paracoccaceae bacterium]